MIKMDAFAQRTFLGRRIAKNFLRKFCAERLNHVIVEEIGERTLTTYSGVGFEVAGVLVHWDMYYAVEDDEGWRDIDGVGIVDGDALFVLEVCVPDRMGEEILSDGRCSSFEKSTSLVCARTREKIRKGGDGVTRKQLSNLPYNTFFDRQKQLSIHPQN
jgi:hypothetical protein